MDGHHRWAATFLCDPKANVGATKIDLPGVALVTTLNLITVGKYDRNGNMGKGNILEFTGNKIGDILSDYIENGIGGQFPITPEEVKAALGRIPKAKGNFELGKTIMMNNADSLPKNIMPGAPARIDMPVIGPDEVAEVRKMLAKGDVDITKPYSQRTNNEF